MATFSKSLTVCQKSETGERKSEFNLFLKVHICTGGKMIRRRKQKNLLSRVQIHVVFVRFTFEKVPLGMAGIYLFSQSQVNNTASSDL